MSYNYLTDQKIEAFVRAAMAEDIGEGDHSTLSAVPADALNRAHLLIKSETVLAGIEMARHIFRLTDPDLKVQVLKNDGDTVTFGDKALIVEGRAQSILQAERLVLNCMQRMSGIADLTARAVKLLEGTDCRLLDTRKTTPCFRLAEKWAVKIGGGQNHRFGLFDLIMLKDNHCDYAGGIEPAVRAAKEYLQRTGKNIRIEVETRNLDEVRQALDTKAVDIIMLDNMSPELMREAVGIIAGRCETEASGGITLETLRPAAESGVNFVSMGALTHSAASKDMSLKAF